MQPLDVIKSEINNANDISDAADKHWCAREKPFYCGQEVHDIFRNGAFRKTEPKLTLSQISWTVIDIGANYSVQFKKNFIKITPIQKQLHLQKDYHYIDLWTLSFSFC